MGNAANKIVENIKTHFILYIYIYIFSIFENHSMYQIIRKNVFRQAADEDEMRRRKNTLCMPDNPREDKRHTLIVLLLHNRLIAFDLV